MTPETTEQIVERAHAPNGGPRQAFDPSLPATTTHQQDLTKAGQRHINIIWERTQQLIAVFVAVVTLVSCVYLLVYGSENMKVLAFALLSNICIMVMSTYYQRTNHTKIGGVAEKDEGR